MKRYPIVGAWSESRLQSRGGCTWTDAVIRHCKRSKQFQIQDLGKLGNPEAHFSSSRNFMDFSRKMSFIVRACVGGMNLASLQNLFGSWNTRPDAPLLVSCSPYPYRKYLGETSKFSGGFPEGSRKAFPIPRTFLNFQSSTNVTTNVPSLQTFIFTEFRRSKLRFDLQ